MQKILIANRGEIALRVMRTAKRMGIQTVAVYSEADAQSRHVGFADEAFYIGPSPANQSYLRADAIIELCLEHSIDAVHPGYGFLSENATFARQLRQANITFIGPSPESMDQMGSKIAAKNAVKAFGVPLVPGMDQPVADLAEALSIAHSIGFPILIKASAGGGGKGIRTVERAEDLAEQMQLAMSEALNAFGDSSVFIERLVAQPRHIEIQVLADQHGNCVYLFERECSVQRRHQKLIEEAPSSCLTPALRQQMGQAAVNVCKASQYTNAGTVEFLLDRDNHFYFLEMNTRLQVEHPVTEMITGLDLVEWQIRVARGESLAFQQSDLQIIGHAIEVRVCAEDPANQFLPDIGPLTVYRPPVGPGIRVDDAYEEGMDIPIYYDPMIAKLIVHAPNRTAAMDKMMAAIDAFPIVGIETTLAFCRWVMTHEAFRSGQFDTGFIQHYFDPALLSRPLTPEESDVIAFVVQQLAAADADSQTPQPIEQSSVDFSTWRTMRSM
jgi:acetyl-CoA carboxylase, biotin carboxylase subunit